LPRSTVVDAVIGRYVREVASQIEMPQGVDADNIAVSEHS
jgi:hypothetical protein